MVDSHSVDRILEKVGKLPVGINRAELLNDMKSADRKLDILDATNAQPTDEKRGDALAKAEKQIHALIDTLKDKSGLVSIAEWDKSIKMDSALHEALERGRTEPGIAFEALLNELLVMKNSANKARLALETGNFHVGIHWPEDVPVSKGQHFLITEFLPQIYERHFKKKCGNSLKTKPGPGPGLRFIAACLAELIDQPLAVSTIFDIRKDYKNRAK